MFHFFFYGFPKILLSKGIQIEKYNDLNPYQLKAVEKDLRSSKDFSYDQNIFQRRQRQIHRSTEVLLHRKGCSPVKLMKATSFHSKIKSFEFLTRYEAAVN